MRVFIKKIKEFLSRLSKAHVGAYAAQSAFFLVLSLIPIILLLLTLIRYTPVTKADVMTIVYEFFPRTIRTTFISIINEVYNQSRAIIPLTAVVAMWSAGRGVLAMTSGLNSIHGERETRNYIYLRLRSALYTVIFLVAIVLTLVVLGFGNSISLFVNAHIPFLQYITDFIIEIRTITMILVLIVVSLCIYRFLPNHKGRIKYALPGAIFNAFGWIFASFLFSIYMDIFKGFSNMYGSLTTIVLIMLWLYFCMYVMLIGGEINVVAEEHFEGVPVRK